MTEGNSVEQQPSCDPFYYLIPESMWLTLTNLTKDGNKLPDGKVRLVLSVNGQERDLYNSYVIDGTIIHSWQMTGWLNRGTSTQQVEGKD